MNYCDWNENIFGLFAGPGHLPGGLLRQAILAAVILLAVGLVQRLWSGGGRRSSALAILDERYARGEIGAEEFRQKLRELRS